MTTPKPGEIRCPTCHRSTPPAAYCTQCGSPIPSGARARPRGMDREELQARIRARRLGDDEAWRRGSAAGAAYEQYRPDPTDAGRREAGPAADSPRVDHFATRDAGEPSDARAGEGREWARPAAHGPEQDLAAAAFAPPPASVPPGDVPDQPYEPQREAPPAAAYVPPPPAVEAEPRIDNYDDAAYDPEAYAYEYDDYDDRRGRGTGVLAVLGFLGLGVLALLAGAVLAGVFTADDGVGIASPTPTAAVEETPAPTPAATPTLQATDGATGSPAPGASPGDGQGPVIFPDGFSAEAQPCDEQPSSPSGCESSGATNDGSLFIWIGFTNGTSDDVINVEIADPAGTTVGEGSIDLGEIGCTPACPSGWAYMGFSGLGPGTYDVVVRRNSEFADRTEFQVEG